MDARVQANREMSMFGCPVSELDDLIKYRFGGDLYEIQFAAISILSDAQDLGNDHRSHNHMINRAKYLMDHVKSELRKL